MSYAFDQFIEDCREALRTDPGTPGIQAVTDNMRKLLENKAFVDQHFGPEAEIGVHRLHEDAEMDFVVLAHVNDPARKSPPHDHGESWAVYGQTVGHTDMTCFERVDGGEGAGDAELKVTDTYRLEVGEVGMYDVGEIHAIDYPDGARMLRVTGRDLDRFPRLVFDLAAGRARVIESATVGNDPSRTGAMD
ncbi:MAG: hypothetical protein NXI16_02055 [Alphaproteobacteria bacterium]|nr:hypothetical protein [Alphaproteobacteria bacterium]